MNPQDLLSYRPYGAAMRSKTRQTITAREITATGAQKLMTEASWGYSSIVKGQKKVQENTFVFFEPQNPVTDDVCRKMCP